MTEMELRELLHLLRGVVTYVEKCLRTEQEKNEDKVKKQLENTGIKVEFVDDPDNWESVESPMEEFEL